MPHPYDKHYQTNRLFGEPYPELLNFFEQIPRNRKVLDLGCGQGRDAIALARMGFDVNGIDASKVGIDQMNAVAKQEGLSLRGQVEDMFQWTDFGSYDIILLDSMFHFNKKDRERELKFLKRIFDAVNAGAWVVICIQAQAKKLQPLLQLLKQANDLSKIEDRAFEYVFVDQESGHRSITKYRMLGIEKVRHGGIIR